MADYDKYYETENLFGAPYVELVEFFKNHEPKGKLLDLGCGQGRDAIALARLGYTVTGVDNSKVGIDQMIGISNAENLKITGLASDIYDFDNYGDFDIVLLDSMFHFEQRDRQKEISLINKIANDLKADGLICVCVQDTGSKVRVLKGAISNSKPDFETVNDSSLVYRYEDDESGHKSTTKYCMYIVRKK
ncbi:methyltransferase domain-containing protein [uncultured Imperialibacter sp.]|uniref:class I SAM-dependent methyltransferase n=1 Tax=uncultured Imperialibacter sp. TaxID=1672639 RepID=UPI0030DD56F4|tara:strand:+ start:3005 stop:3574 length:570 start_codon:yes stop_codon:yes gene_type:complete